jgi:hypothetical protein
MPQTAINYLCFTESFEGFGFSVPMLIELVVSGMFPFTFRTFRTSVAAVSSSVLRGPVPIPLPSLLSVLALPLLLLLHAVRAAIDTKRINAFFINAFEKDR